MLRSGKNNPKKSRGEKKGVAKNLGGRKKPTPGQKSEWEKKACPKNKAVVKKKVGCEKKQSRAKKSRWQKNNNSLQKKKL